MTLFQVTPLYLPALSGVGDYAHAIETGLSAGGRQVVTLCSAADPGSARGVEPSAQALVTALHPARTVLLHYSGYGYAHWGLCFWLVNGLARWKAQGPGRRLVTMFHEVAASGPIWRASFWTAAPQRHLARRLAGLTDRGFVSSHGGEAQLRALAPDLRLERLRVFSNIPEPARLVPMEDRAPVAVVFGSAVRREKVYSTPGVDAALTLVLDRAGVTRIVDIGPGSVAPASFAGHSVKVLGPLPAERVSDHLAMARLGLIFYPAHVLEKSGVAAAFFAHGVALVNLCGLGAPPPDLVPGQTYLRPGDPADATAVAQAGHAWYRNHDRAATIARIAEALI